MKTLMSALAIGLGGTAALADTTVDSMSDQQLRDMVIELKGEVDSLRAEQNDDWLTERRAEEIRGLVSDVLADADTRSSLQGSGLAAGYNKGFFVGTADGNWLMKVNGQLQVRWSFNRVDDQPDAYGFEIRRAKLKFSGHVVDPSWQYKLSVASNRQTVQFANSSQNANVFIEDAYINKKLDNDMYVRVGQYKVPFLREELVSSTRQLAVDRSMINNAFTWTRSQGLMLGWKTDRMKIEAMYGEGPNNINTQITNNNGRQSLTARGEFLFGDEADWGMFKGFNAKNTDGKMGFMLGAAVGWFNSRGTGGSTIEYGNGDVQRSVSWTIDGTLAGDGWQLFSYFVWSDGKDRNIAAPRRDTQESWGWVVQGGVLLADDFELFARYELGHINDGNTNNPLTTGGLSNDDLSALTVGLNWFMNKNVKFTMDWGYAFDPVSDGGTAPTSADYTSSGTGWRNSLGEDGEWLLRAQMQLIF